MLKNKVVASLTVVSTVLTGCSAPLLSEGEVEVIKEVVESASETSADEASSETSSINEDEAVFGITRSDLYMTVYHELVDDFGMSEDDLKSFLESSEYDFETDYEDGFYHLYIISDPDREGMRLILDCTCDGEYEGDTSGDYIFYSMTYQDRNGHEEYIQFNSSYWMDDYDYETDYETWCYARITSKDGDTSNLTTIDFDSLDEMEKYFFIME